MDILDFLILVAYNYVCLVLDVMFLIFYFVLILLGTLNRLLLDYTSHSLPEIVKALLIAIPLLIAVAYLTLAERKLMATIQRRHGPDVIGAFGLLQPLADGAKLFLKEQVHPSASPTPVFLIAPALSFFLSFVSYSIVPYAKHAAMSEINIGLIFLLTTSSFAVICIIIAGWSGNSKYGFLGALRSTAQMISYEISLGFMLLCPVVLSGTFDLSLIVEDQDSHGFNCIIFSPFAVMFIGAILAETSRHPFDLPEAEAELVSGFNTEYSGMPFALFSLAEYANMFIMGNIYTVLFLGGWLAPFSFLSFIPGSVWFSLKVAFFAFIYSWSRGGLPRYRYDYLMALGWKVYLPLSIAYFIGTVCFCYALNLTPE